MDEKIIKFKNIYFSNCEKIEEKDGLFSFEDLKTGRKTYPIKIIEFIKKDEFLKGLEDLYLVKFHYFDDKYEYKVYFKDKNLGRIRISILEKIQIPTGKFPNKIEIDLIDKEETNVNDKRLFKIANELINNIIYNSRDRMSLLLEKEL